MGTQPPPPKVVGAPSPIFSPFLLWRNGWMHQDASWHEGRPQLRRLCARWGPRSRLPKRGAQFLTHVYCGQTAGWMKLVLGTEVGLIPGDFVLHGDPAPPPKGGGAPLPIFCPFLLWPSSWMHQDATWYGCRPQHRRLCVRWRPTPPPQKGG